MTADTFDAAVDLIAAVRTALSNGVLHYSSDGRPLVDEREILTEMRLGRRVVVDASADTGDIDASDVSEGLRSLLMRN